MVAELFGKRTGCARGRGGSMHLIDRSVGYMGSVSILSSVVPISAGAAFSAKNAGGHRVSVAFLGDGAADEGSFYETINLAALMEVPVVFVVENNLYAGMSDASVRHPKEYSLERVALGLGACYYKVDGNDWAEVYNTARVAVLMARAGSPVVMECMTYRHMAHSAPIFDDKLGYRKVDDKETRLAACPLIKLKNELDKWGVNQGAFDSIENAIHKEIDVAIKFADKSAMPKAEELLEGVYHE